MTMPYTSLVEHAAKALAFHRIPNHDGRRLRWPEDEHDTLSGRDGTVPFVWEFTETLRAEARAMLEAIGITPEHDAIAAEPVVVNKGRVFYTTETRYVVSITPDEFDLIQTYGHWIKSITHHLRHTTQADGLPHLSNSQQFGQGIAFNLRMKNDTPENRDAISEAITNYIELCRAEKERKA